MKHSLLIGAGLIAGTAFAAPGPSPTFKDYKTDTLGRSHRAIPIRKERDESDYAATTEYFANWSGAIQTANAGDTFTAVSARFTVPHPSVPTGQPKGSYSGAAWVGIDGSDSTKSLWQAGAVWSVDNSGSTPTYAYNVWYEWLPNALITVPNFPVKAGDMINVNLKSTSPTTGVVVIIDETSKQTTTITTSAPTPTATLAGKTVEWITEDLSGGGGLLPFANYGTLCYYNTSFNTASGGYYNSASADLAFIEQNGQVISQATRLSSTEIETQYK